MLYRDEYHPKVKADIKKLDKSILKELFSIHIEGILREPYAEEGLHGDLKGVFSYHFRKNKVDYRIAYTIDEGAKIVYILMIGKRESFYEILKRRLS